MVKEFILMSLISCSVVAANYIRIYNAERCNKESYYPITIHDINIEVKNGYATISGSLNTDVDILAPVQAALVVERYIKALDIWVTIPCINDVGSCTYYNLCTFGKPKNSTCPYPFDRNNVPCRCPIPKGAYKLKPEIDINLSEIPEKLLRILDLLSLSSPATGTYYIHSLVTQGNKLLTCYTLYVDYYDAYQVADSIETNEIIPFIP